MVPFMMLMPVPMASHDQKSHVVPHFDCIDPRKAIVPLTMPNASDDTKASAYDQKSYAKFHINHRGLRNRMVLLITLSCKLFQSS